MGIIKYKPTTNGRRNMTSSDFAEITKTTPEKTLLESQSHTARREPQGQNTVRHRGGGQKQKYRDNDFKRIKDGKGGQLVRSAGTSAQLLGKEGKYAIVRLTSGETRMILLTCRATIGTVGNGQHELIKIGKAGRKRWMGIRPTVRGSVMNPNDHPHGGGEGKAPIGRPSPMSPWGKKTLGKKTRSSKARSEKLIIRHRKSR